MGAYHMKYIRNVEKWMFRQATTQTWLPAVVPGCVHTDLLTNNKIIDPFYGTNEHDLQWIDKVDWEYKSVFDVESCVLNKEVQELKFHGLDTYADVYLNNELILSADNMFRSWTIDVTGKLLKKNNELRIYFRSPINEDLPKLAELGYALPATNDQSELGGLGEKKVSIFARKAPYHYGWDWGPRFVTSGIWRPVEIVAWSCIVIRDVYINQLHVTEKAALIQAEVEIESKHSGEVTLVVKVDDLSWETIQRVEAGAATIKLPLSIQKPKLWWSMGLGEAHCYTFEVETHLSGSKEEDRTKQKTGLRTIKLVRDKAQDGNGATFHFELNGVAVFAKGANHIPNDSFIADITDARYHYEILSAVEANMNMLRIWGGGFYEQDIFYDLCDDYGILVWQDFMFACSMYPGDEKFLANIKAEAYENVKRLRNHPSIALWCGNNEIDTAWSKYIEDGGWGWKQQFTEKQREKLWHDYEQIFHKILPDVVNHLHQSVAYWPSSPMVALSNNELQHAHAKTTAGDVHYWGVWHNVEPFENYQTHLGRFMSEYGFQSFPEYATIRTFAEEEDLAIDSNVMLAHQKNENGNRLIKAYMDIYMKQPKDFKSFLYMSQVLQADAMKMAIEAHRRHMPYCMGSLYWQMNDCWPVASWSGIDYYGRWKALNYYARRSFNDQLISFQEHDNHLDVYFVSDLFETQQGHLTVMSMTLGGKEIHSHNEIITLKSKTSEVVASLEFETLLDGHCKENIVVVASWETKFNDTLYAFHYLVKNKELSLVKAKINIDEKNIEGATTLTLSTDKLAKQVYLQSEVEGIWSDNYFDLAPGMTKTVTFKQFTGAKQLTPACAGTVQVTSMSDYIQD